MNSPARAVFLAIGFWAAGARCAEPPRSAAQGAPRAAARRSLEAAAKWLWAQQAEDGGWHSGTYRQMAAGRALTPLVLDALGNVPVEVCRPPERRRQRGLEFIRGHIDAEGVIGRDDPTMPEYPTFATALAVKCLLAAGDAGDAATIIRARRHLEAEQLCEARGFPADHVAHGGWAFGGPLPVGGSPGHVDIVHTRLALEAIRAARRAAPNTAPAGDKAVFARAEVFLRIVQRRGDDPRPQPSTGGQPRRAGWKPPFDGGFYFSPIALAANKGREAIHDGEPYFRSYATATCEGILALLACGVAPGDERVRAAAAWLRDHPRLDYPEGVPEDHPEPWGQSIAYYHFAVRARAYAALGWPGPWRERIADLLVAEQDDDGSFRNRGSRLMKEDDPLLATALAVAALAECCR